MLFDDLIQDNPFVNTEILVNELTRLQCENLDLKFQVTLLHSELDLSKRLADINSKVYSFVK